MKLPPSQYRGVIRQHHGKWRAQVYSNNRCIWLGSFCTEVAAAKAYDIAAQSIHGCNAATNFKPLSQSDSNSARAELLFLQSRTTTEIISILRNHTYHEEFERSLHSDRIQHIRHFNASINVRPDAKETRQLLFHKIISPSDVGSQNRLLIPRRHAKHFPFDLSSSGASPEVMIDAEDETGKIWKFRCTFWRGCRYHVLNGRWTDFVREKRLKPGDMISFWRVTDELDAEHLLIECDSRRAATASSSTLQMPKSQPKRIVRLFGINIPTDNCNN